MENRKIKRMLGTDIEINVITDDPSVERRIEMVLDFFNRFEQEFSRFLPHSVLSLLNTYKTFEVSDRFIQLLMLSKEYNDLTLGYFNPLSDVSSIGYSHDFASGDFEKVERRSDMNMDHIIVDGKTVSLGQDQRLDFGGIGKGYAVDLASKLLKIFGYDDFMINAGGDIYASGLNNQREKWVIALENPYDMNRIFGTVDLSGKAIATSGKYKRKWMIGDNEYHHIIDPKTGNNRKGMLSVAVIADSSAQADAFTKAIFNMEPQAGFDLLEKHGLAGIIVTEDGDVMMTKDIADYGLELA